MQDSAAREAALREDLTATRAALDDARRTGDAASRQAADLEADLRSSRDKLVCCLVFLLWVCFIFCKMLLYWRLSLHST
jgi:hypothetical protein